MAKPRAYGSKYPEISSAIQDAIQAAVSGQAPVADALSRAQATITPLLPRDKTGDRVVNKLPSPRGPLA